MNPLAKGIRDYLALRRGLGFKLIRHEAGLKEFASFLARKRTSHITVALALEWSTQHPTSNRLNGRRASALCVASPVTGVPRIR
jgi:hypothetical protein